ncbi:DDE_3 domain-containing protein [Trichonephila clavipes]|nr:DDE_3 domain-containing protein [Trichonephila clavipes]
MMVLDSISIDDGTGLYIIRKGTLTVQLYKDEILRSIVALYTATHNRGSLIHSHALYHQATSGSYVVDNFLFNEGILRMDWSAYSSDMNLVQRACDNLRSLSSCLSPLERFKQLEIFLRQK